MRLPDSPRLVHAPFLHWPVVGAIAVACLGLGLRQRAASVSPIARVAERPASATCTPAPKRERHRPLPVRGAAARRGSHRPTTGREEAVRLGRAVAKAATWRMGSRRRLAVLSQEADRLGASGDAALAAPSASRWTACAATSTTTSRTRAHRVRRRANGAHAGGRVPRGTGAHAAAPARGPRHHAHGGHGERGGGAGIRARTSTGFAATSLQRLPLSTSHPGRGDGARGGRPGGDCRRRRRPGARAGAARRGAASRCASRRTGPGSGLGLAITRDLCELYGGAVALEASPAGGLRVSLRLPAAG